MTEQPRRDTEARARADERRAHRRYRLKLPINLRAERWTRGLLVDLSRGGLRLRGAGDGTEGQLVHMTLRSYHAGTCPTRGRIVRVDATPDDGELAIEFTEPCTTLSSLLDAAEALPDSDRAMFLATELRPTLDLELA